MITTFWKLCFRNSGLSGLGIIWELYQTGYETVSKDPLLTFGDDERNSFLSRIQEI